LIRAACYLHDTNWRAHPDYRAEVCFETVTRANLSGLDHEGRLFLGAAMRARYKSGAATYDDPRLLTLLPSELSEGAETLGRALRLGAMLSGAAPGSLENTELIYKKNKLLLRLKGTARALMGEAVERRLGTLASRLDCEPQITLTAN